MDAQADFHRRRYFWRDCFTRDVVMGGFKCEVQHRV